MSADWGPGQENWANSQDGGEPEGQQGRVQQEDRGGSGQGGGWRNQQDLNVSAMKTRIVQQFMKKQVEQLIGIEVFETGLDLLQFQQVYS